MNSVNLIGRLTKDPELRYTPNGNAVCTLRLAVSRRKRNGDDQGAVFVDVVSFGPRAEAVAEHMTKGRQVAVSGRLEYQEWKAQDGSPRSRHEVIGEQVQFLGARSTGSDSTDSESDVAPDEEAF
jgi:single-strand DNA-binding protein